jgi:PAS domain S-box-containing protein
MLELFAASPLDAQAVLYQFTDTLFRASSLHDVYDAALEAVRRGLCCDRAALLIFDDAQRMRFVRWIGLSEKYRHAVDGHSPWTVETHDPQPICIDDVSMSDLPKSLKETIAEEGIGAVAFIPLVVDSTLLGKFMAYYDDRHAFSRADIDLAVTIARQLGFGIQRVRSDEERRKAVEISGLLTSIIENSDDAIISKDLCGTITSWNPGAERVFGYSAEELIGKPIAIVVPPDRVDEDAGILERIRRGERVRHYETIRQRKDGTLIHVSLTVSPIRDKAGQIIGASKIARDITEAKQTQARHDMLTREIQHRTQNLFAVVQAVASRSFAGKNTVAEAEAAVMSRLGSLAQTHVLLMDRQWQGAELSDVVNAEMTPYAERVLAQGPRIVLSARAAQNFTLALYELVTNAAKHGALANSVGRVFISWSVNKTNSVDQFHFRWQERGGPPVSEPTQKGFGTTVLEHVMLEYFDIPPSIHFEKEGVRYEISGPLDSVRDRRASRKQNEPADDAGRDAARR